MVKAALPRNARSVMHDNGWSGSEEMTLSTTIISHLLSTSCTKTKYQDGSAPGVPSEFVVPEASALRWNAKMCYSMSTLSAFANGGKRLER